ncbi:MAG TPA: glycosyltransferase family 2 protein [Flavobacterium sp.]|jgi:glycosyltransferase involved in cell wall biosynthesis
MKSITVFTPTFNRAFCLHQVYESLCRQTSKDFAWLIIDDGSTDNTNEIVESWISERKIDIKYVYKKNGGMHTAHNTAYDNIDTKLNVCIDSDDFMPDDAIFNILELWEKKGSSTFAGIIGLDAFKDGSIVGTKIPDTITESTLSALYQKHGVSGDKKLVLRTEVVRNYPKYPEFEEERLVPLGILYKMIDEDFKCLCSNNVFCIVEYLPDGSSNNIMRQYRKSPKGFYYARAVEMRYSKSLSFTFTRAMHLISSALFAKRLNIFYQNPNKVVTLLAVPFGLALHCYILYKSSK